MLVPGVAQLQRAGLTRLGCGGFVSTRTPFSRESDSAARETTSLSHERFAFLFFRDKSTPYLPLASYDGVSSSPRLPLHNGFYAVILAVVRPSGSVQCLLFWASGTSAILVPFPSTHKARDVDSICCPETSVLLPLFPSCSHKELTVSIDPHLDRILVTDFS